MAPLYRLRLGPAESRIIYLRLVSVAEWDGKPQRVMVLDQGFAWNGATYRSLTEIAFAITGTRWSGPRFFVGLNGERIVN